MNTQSDRVLKKKMFSATFKSWEELFDQATEFATTIGEGNVQSISHSQDGMSGIVVVWYWE